MGLVWDPQNKGDSIDKIARTANIEKGKIFLGFPRENEIHECE